MRLKLGVFGKPEDELAETVNGAVPQWIERLYLSYGTTSKTAPASASVLLGWEIEPRGHELLATTTLDETAAQAQLEDARVWVIARHYAPADKNGNVRWSHGLFP